MEGLKKVLKMRGHTYEDVSNALDLSESSVKRIFTAKDGNLGRIQDLCDWLEIRFEDLVTLSVETEREENYVMTQPQESFFLKNPSALQFFVELYEYGQTPEEVRLHYGLTRKSVIKYLNDLERIGLLEVHPNDKIKFKFSGFFTVRDGGTLGKIILRNSMENATEYVLKTLGQKVKERQIVTTFTIGELLFTKESAKEMIKEYDNLRDKLYSTSSREMRVYPKRDLIPFQYQLGLIPERMMKGKIVSI